VHEQIICLRQTYYFHTFPNYICIFHVMGEEKFK
jgi:hypothetical protein